MSTEAAEPSFLFRTKLKPKRVHNPEMRVEKNEEEADVCRFELT